MDDKLILLAQGEYLVKHQYWLLGIRTKGKNMMEIYMIYNQMVVMAVAKNTLPKE